MLISSTAALPKSFAFFDKGLHSSETRSTTASIAELISSMMIIQTNTAISSNFLSGETGKKNAMTMPGITTLSSCRNACSFLHADYSPSNDLTSTGKLFLSIDDPKIVRAYAARTGLAGHNKNSITDLSELEYELSLVRTLGYARDNEELELGVRCMAAGIRDESGKLVGGLSISAPADRLQEEWVADLMTTAQQISVFLGYVAQPQKAG